MNKKIFISTLLATTLIGYNALAAQMPDWVLPIKKVTPGAINKDVTQANIKNNICKANWTSTVRPAVSYTNKLKVTQIAGDYKSQALTFGTDPSLYEEDHLISLQLGGSPTDPKNLWPQPYVGNNARKKDAVETALKRMICAGTIKLSVAQKAIANDWVKAYNKYVTPADQKNIDPKG